MKLKAFAKINLTLRVFDQCTDGFHNLESIMQSVSLCDYVTVEPADSGITVTCDDPNVPTGPKNIAYKAAELFKREAESRKAEKQKNGVKIHIEKNIPMAAGLAGGSADAAAVLFSLNQLSAFPLSDISLLQLASQIGSDVPFCLTGGTCLVEGRGEKVTKQESWPKTYFILVKPDFEVSTKWAYTVFDRMSNVQFPMSNECKNYLEVPVIGKFPEIARIKEKLLALGCSDAQMSGSGSAVFGATRQKDEAEVILEMIKKEYTRSYLVETVDEGIKTLTPACRQVRPNPSPRGRGA